MTAPQGRPKARKTESNSSWTRPERTIRLSRLDAMRNLSWAHEIILDPWDVGMAISRRALMARPAEAMDEIYYGRHDCPVDVHPIRLESMLYAAAEEIRREFFPRTSLRNLDGTRRIQL
ncbi:MAG: hypothetical protein Q3962_06560 [Corynebacterium sp.]|nr:hypothetical protein [Corynebacterium sp.]